MTNTSPATQLWFQDSLVIVRVSASEGEVLHVLEGEFRLQVKDQEHRLGAGDFLLTPKGVPHTYRLESAQGGRCLTITGRGDFERFVRAVSRPAERPELPSPAGAPSAEAIQEFKSNAARCGIELIGPPLH